MRPAWRDELLAILRLTVAANSGAHAMLTGHRPRREQARAVRALMRGQRYLHGYEPNVARWEREK